MKNFSKFLCVSLLAAGLWSCSSEEPLVPDTPEQDGPIPTFEGDRAAMTIRIFSPTDNGTRSDVTEGGASYTNGNEDENHVEKLSFYFYDRNGDYVTCYEGATYEDSNASNPGALVEEVGVSRIVLTELLGQNYPSYVVAVLNHNIAGSTTATNIFKKSLSAVKEEVLTRTPWASVNKNGADVITNFVMTSATHSNNNEDGYFFATPITKDNFAVQPGNASQDGPWVGDKDENGQPTALAAEPVDVFVERLASKVQILFPAGGDVYGKYQDKDFTVDLSYAPYTNSANATVTGHGYYEIDLDGTFEVDGDTQNKKTLTVRLYGWGVNGQAKKTKFFKEVNTNFITDDGWNYDGTNRCYWAKTPGYGSNPYPSSFDDVKDKTGNTETTDTDDAAPSTTILKYVSWRSLVENGFGNTNAYVLPHTEAGSRINLSGNEINHPAVTEILIAGQIVDKETGKGITLFQLADSYYTAEGIANYVLNSAGVHLWYNAGDNEKGEKVYKQMETTDVEVKYGFDGTFKLQLSTEGKTREWYKDNNGVEKWSDNTEINTFLNSYLPQHQSYCYNDGMLYYNIPIRHLRPYTQGNEIKTGMFGVVRNHWYQVSINSVKKIGHSVYRPDEHIIPPSDDTRYMIGSTIKILSWRLVPQSVDL